jgi:hypothetical protein
MTEVYTDPLVQLLHGDCIEVMAGLEADSVDAVVTDPPYGLPGGFMGKSWDRFAGHEDAGFAYWLGGLIDGEGHFAIKKHSRGTHAPYFQLHMRADEEGTLRGIHRHLRIGTITRDEKREPNPMVKWVVQDKEGCQRLVDLLDKYPLRAKKRLDYNIWREAVCEWTDRPRGNRWHGGTDNTHMAELRRRIMAVRKYTEPAWSGHEFQDWSRLWGMEAIRVLKPGGWLLAFGGTRAYHRMAAGLEDAGFEIRDTLQHIYASGFPKGKANLKPAHEPIVLARKPGPLRPLGIDECRIGMVDGDPGKQNYHQNRAGSPTYEVGHSVYEIGVKTVSTAEHPAGRWPSNVLLSDPELFDQPNPYVVGSGASAGSVVTFEQEANIEGKARTGGDGNGVTLGITGPKNAPSSYGDSGGYSRFFIIPKADRAERERGLGDRPKQSRESKYGSVQDGRPHTPEGYEYHREARANVHPTVKPIDLMRHLVRLVTPPGGVVLDPFLGSGTTCLAASEEGFRSIGIERELEYLEIAKGRLMATPMGLGLDHGLAGKASPKTHPDLSKHQPKRRAPGENYSGGWAGTDEEPAA